MVSLGQAYNDTHANTFVSSVKLAHRWLGFIHAMYMAGCLAGPFVATAIASAGLHSRWNLFYIVPSVLSVVNLTFVGICFQDRMTLLMNRSRHSNASGDGVNSGKTASKEIRDTLRSPSVWLLSLFFFFFLGAAITVGGAGSLYIFARCFELTVLGWMVEYLVNVRKGDLGDMGYVPAGLYGGGFLGRLLLAEPTYKFGERRMVLIYAVLCVALQLVFWL